MLLGYSLYIIINQHIITNCVIHLWIRFICRFHQSILVLLHFVWCSVNATSTSCNQKLTLWIRSHRIILIEDPHISIWKADYYIWKLWRKASQDEKTKRNGQDMVAKNSKPPMLSKLFLRSQNNRRTIYYLSFFFFETRSWLC